MADIELIDFMEKLDPMRADLWEATCQDLYLILFFFFSTKVLQPQSLSKSSISMLPYESCSHANAVAQCKQLLGAATRRQDGF